MPFLLMDISEQPPKEQAKLNDDWKTAFNVNPVKLRGINWHQNLV